MSGNNGHGSVIGATPTTDRYDRVGKAYGFDGVNDRIRINDQALNGKNAFSLSIWIKPLPGAAHFISGANVVRDNEFLISLISSNRLHFASKLSGGNGVPYTSAFSTSQWFGNWVHLIMTRANSSSGMEFFIDGRFAELFGMAAGAPQIDSNGLWLGADQDSVGGGWQTGNYFKGSIDEVRIYDRALSASEVSALYALERPEKDLLGAPDESFVFTLKDSNGTSLSSRIVDRTELSKKGGWARFSVAREPARIPQPWDGLELSAGHAHSLILKPDGPLSGMGANLSGQLGLADGNDSLTPSPIDSAGVTQVSAGGHHSLYIKQDGSAWGMGSSSKAPPVMLRRHTNTELGAHSTFASYLTLDGNLLATRETDGHGKVRVWDLASNGDLNLKRLVNSPDSTANGPTFGESIFISSNALGVGSGQTTKYGAHAGSFYLFDLTNGSKQADFNPSPHSAQYFGRENSYSQGVFCVSESGNSSWSTDAAYTFYRLDNFSAVKIHRYVHPGSYSYIGGMDSSGDYFVTTVQDPTDYHMFVWKVSRNGSNQATGVTKFAEYTEAGTNSLKGKIATNGTYVAVGISNAQVNGSASGSVTLLKINANGTLTKLHQFAPPGAQAGMKFGCSVEFVGDVLLVGSSDAQNSSPGSGLVYAYSITSSALPSDPVSFFPHQPNPETPSEASFLSPTTVLLSQPDKAFFIYIMSATSPMGIFATCS